MKIRFLAFLMLFFATTTFAISKTYPTRSLAGRNLGDLFTKYTGIEGRVPMETNIDFQRNLEAMWVKKVNVAHKNPVVILTGNELVLEYRTKDPYHMTLSDYERHLEAVIDETRKTINWKTVSEIEDLDPRRERIVRKIVSSLGGKDLVAYSLTELMPGFDGGLNVEVFDFLLRNGGRRYVESIPAMFDKKVSFGPYQFTEFAWYGGAGGFRGGSRLNSALRHPVTHGSVMKLRSDEHHIIALLLLIDNLSWIVNRLDNKELGVLESTWRYHHSDIVQVIATAHHCPHGRHGATGTTKRWLDHGAKKAYWNSCSRHLSDYAQKTAINLAALQ